MNWKTYPMGAAANERTQHLKKPACLDHAVDVKTRQPLCGVKETSLCMDDSLATNDFPDCKRCVAKIVSQMVLNAVPRCSPSDTSTDFHRYVEFFMVGRNHFVTSKGRTKSELRQSINQLIKEKNVDRISK